MPVFASNSGEIRLRATVSHSDIISTQVQNNRFRHLDSQLLDQVPVASVSINTSSTRGYIFQASSANNGYLVDVHSQEKIAYDITLLNPDTLETIPFSEIVNVNSPRNPQLVQHISSEYLLCINTTSTMTQPGYAHDMITFTYTNL